VKRLDALDGWRAIAALMVVAAHLQIGGVIDVAKLGSVAYGHLGVEYFFGISGFVISRGLVKESRPSLRGFYIRRFFRIIPPLALYVAVILALSQLGWVDPQAKGVLRALTFTCNLKGADVGCGGWLGAHTWSLSVEEQFYLVIPLALALVRPRWMLAAFVVAIGPIALALIAVHQIDAATLVADFTVIGLGVFCGLNEARVANLASRMPAWLAIVAFAATLAIVYLPASRPTTVIYFLGLGPLILFVLMVSTFRGGWIATIMGTGPLPRLGVVSYSLYLWQQLAAWKWPTEGLAFHIAADLAVIAFAFASYRWFELPLIQFGRRLADRVNSPAVGATAPAAPTP
jgi:peptidoglycan/LPS O-acetylase OafA/YrhL